MQYALKFWDGVVAVEAVAERSMALLGRPLDVDLEATPQLCWLWRVDAPLATADMMPNAYTDRTRMIVLRSGAGAC